VRILIYGINFAPELVGNGKYTGEMAHWLADRGHDVRVVVAPPFNPAGKVFGGYSSWQYRKEIFSTNGAGSLTAYRCPLWVSRNRSALNRIFHLGSFALSSLPVMLGQVFWRPSLVMVIEPTALCIPSGLVTAWASGATSWLHIQDFEIDAGFAIGILKSNVLRDLIAAADKKSMMSFDRVSTISPKMMDRLWEKGFPPACSVMFPNWVDTIRIFPTGVASSFRDELSIPRDAVVALYSGTMGRKQGLEILAEAAGLLAKDPTIQFVFCGDGSYRGALAAASASLANVHWLPLQPIERLNELLNLADIHLLPQCAGVADLMMPSKLTGILASGRPVVTTAAAGTQLAVAVQDCGIRVPAHDGAAFADAIARLAKDAQLRMRLGQNARQYAETNLDKEKILASFEQECLRICNSVPDPTALEEHLKQSSPNTSWKSSIDRSA
jgi:colanic acid biosynthesis glycosyl transferase WcaI